MYSWEAMSISMEDTFSHTFWRDLVVYDIVHAGGDRLAMGWIEVMSDDDAPKVVRILSIPLLSVHFPHARHQVNLGTGVGEEVGVGQGSMNGA